MFGKFPAWQKISRTKADEMRQMIASTQPVDQVCHSHKHNTLPHRGDLRQACDAPNQSSFPYALLRPEEIYQHTMSARFFHD